MSFEANRPVKTSVKTFEIVEQLSRTDRIRLSQLAAELDESKGIVHNHLSTLRELGYVRKTGDYYQLSPKFLSIGFRARSYSRLFTAAHAPLSEFVDRLDTGVVLCERASTECIVTDVQRLPQRLDLTVGTPIPVSESLTGLVAAVSATDGAPTVSAESTGADYEPTAIREAVAEQGYVVGPLTTSTSIDCVAVPIVDEAGDCCGSVGAVLPADRSEQRSVELTEAAVGLRTRIESRLDSGWESTRSFATEKHSWIS
ncbi:IclR family transcriptional regulator [Halohasta salina]|uniref:IclR family transcriptional regulator n=1 Tax=Halohasta salina TaxID=2961621 RepID=UPI0020A58C1E|nr:helix-turn-helix domain-containing protein [Halohasta salina]